MDFASEIKNEPEKIKVTTLEKISSTSLSTFLIILSFIYVFMFLSGNGVGKGVGFPIILILLYLISGVFGIAVLSFALINIIRVKHIWSSLVAILIACMHPVIYGATLEYLVPYFGSNGGYLTKTLALGVLVFAYFFVLNRENTYRAN